ncbi:hypothetical protein DF121_20040 [Burkholderia stagnalis]|nr:hypothetical protein DF145_20860 [Burkholderia stagnalis]RQX98141.1 hypothetical protein DF121_20040 [Burkholderia stagnalis]RQY12246.1 hypothetical protein DF115_23160 [Burkholderia stagnalis]RQY28451.1 hypothetical protein DF114_22095 [Burkholderia stagnalis]
MAVHGYYCDISLVSSAARQPRSVWGLAGRLQQYRQDVAGLPRDRALKHNESSSILPRERRTRPSS